jgi:hypothetical protein
VKNRHNDSRGFNRFVHPFRSIVQSLARLDIPCLAHSNTHPSPTRRSRRSTIASRYATRYATRYSLSLGGFTLTKRGSTTVVCQGDSQVRLARGARLVGQATIP